MPTLGAGFPEILSEKTADQQSIDIVETTLRFSLMPWVSFRFLQIQAVCRLNGNRILLIKIQMEPGIVIPAANI